MRNGFVVLSRSLLFVPLLFTLKLMTRHTDQQTFLHLLIIRERHLSFMILLPFHFTNRYHNSDNIIQGAIFAQPVLGGVSKALSLTPQDAFWRPSFLIRLMPRRLCQPGWRCQEAAAQASTHDRAPQLLWQNFDQVEKRPKWKTKNGLWEIECGRIS